VQVEHSGEDAVGSRFALAFKERIKSSALFRLAESRKDATFAVHLVSLDLATPSESTGHASAIAMTFTAVSPSGPEYFLTTGVHAVGTKQVDASADQELASIDKTIDDSGLRVRCH
jgi:hypothetical protein